MTCASVQVMDLQNVPTVHRTIDTHIIHYHVDVPLPNGERTQDFSAPRMLGPGMRLRCGKCSVVSRFLWRSKQGAICSAALLPARITPFVPCAR